MRNLFVTLAMVVVSACGGAEPSLDIAEDTPDDLAALAGGTFAEMVAAFPGRADCLEGLTLEGAQTLDAQARYLPDTATLVVRIPATAPQLRRSLVHELAHHLEFSCDEQEAARPAFLAAQGLDERTTWFTAASWEETPSEQWATAVVEHVLGERDPRSGIFLEPGAVAVVADWAVAGDP
jgi:hypothetical protein